MIKWFIMVWKWMGCFLLFSQVLQLLLKWRMRMLPPTLPQLPPLRSPQHPLLWDKRNDRCWRGPGGDHPAGPGDEEDGAEHVQRPELWTQRQRHRRPQRGGGSCQENVCLLISTTTTSGLCFHCCPPSDTAVSDATVLWSVTKVSAIGEAEDGFLNSAKIWSILWKIVKFT